MTLVSFFISLQRYMILLLLDWQQVTVLSCPDCCSTFLLPPSAQTAFSQFTLRSLATGVAGFYSKVSAGFPFTKSKIQNLSLHLRFQHDLSLLFYRCTPHLLFSSLFRAPWCLGTGLGRLPLPQGLYICSSWGEALPPEI